MVNLDHNFFELVNYSKESFIQQPTDKAVVGNFYPHFKILPKYSLHEDTFHLAIQQENCTVVQDPSFQRN